VAEQYKTFAQFWPFYVSQHRNRTNRRLHFIGTTLAIAILVHWLWFAWGFWSGDDRVPLVSDIAFFISTMWHLILAPLCGYGLAWAGHFFFQKNKPATFSYPLWSLRGDLKMYGLMWLRQMDQEIERLSPPRPTQLPAQKGRVLPFRK
jgi:hypothetical protein